MVISKTVSQPLILEEGEQKVSSNVNGMRKIRLTIGGWRQPLCVVYQYLIGKDEFKSASASASASEGASSSARISGN